MDADDKSVDLCEVYEIIRDAVKPQSIEAVGLTTKEDIHVFKGSANLPNLPTPPVTRRDPHLKIHELARRLLVHALLYPCYSSYRLESRKRISKETP